jgi:hypothetical protein
MRGSGSAVANQIGYVVVVDCSLCLGATEQTSALDKINDVAAQRRFWHRCVVDLSIFAP